MPAPLAHFLILGMAVSKDVAKYREFFLDLGPPAEWAPGVGGLGSSRIAQWAYLGAAGPDLCGADDNVAWVFDLMHWKKSNVFVANWLRDMPRTDPWRKRVYTAFILGYLCHMAGDIIIHPYVNTFAGTYDDQEIKIAAKSCLAWIEMFKEKQCAMHKYVEVHQDAHVATRYFGVGEVSDGGEVGRPSWRGFVQDMEKDRLLSSGLVGLYQQTVNSTYDMPSDRRLETDKIADAMFHYGSRLLDDVYDAAISPVPDLPDMTFVNHPRRDRGYDEYLWKAASLTTQFWDAALTLQGTGHSVQDRMNFYSVVRPYNLDTGFAIEVYANPWKIYIRHDHIWADFLGATTHVHDQEMPESPTPP